MRTRRRIIAAALGVLGLGALAPGEPAPGDAGASSRYTEAGALLDALETADRDIETFHSKIIYERYFALQDDRHTRGGDLYYKVEGEAGGAERPVRTFGVHFDWLVLDGAKREERQAWMFNGQWLVEKRFEAKQYVAHQIARPGERIDPLRLGEGPLPIPIGQRKADILARYDAEVLPTTDGFDPEDPRQTNYMNAVVARGAVQLRLTPREDRLDEDAFREIRLWYVQEGDERLLPLLSRTEDRKGDESFVLLAGVEVNEPLPDGVVDITPPPVEEGWDIQEERLRAEEGGG